MTISITGKAGLSGLISCKNVPEGGSDFVTDTFTESSETVLGSHTGELGATWTVHPSYAASAAVNGTTDRVFHTGTTAYYASGSPPSADYYVQADFFVASVISVNAGICARMSTSTDTMYSVRLNNGTTWELRLLQPGSGSTLGSSTNQIPSVGQSKTVRLICNGTSISVTVNGVSEISVTDATISAAGKAGIRCAGVGSDSTGYHFDNFSAR